MRLQHAEGWTRRCFLGGLTWAGAAGLLGLHARPVSAEPPPETTTIRLFKVSGICIAPQYVAEEFLRGEGFTEVRYAEVGAGAGLAKALASGEAHLSLNFVAPVLLRLDAGDPIVVLGGVHVGCFELFGTDRVPKLATTSWLIVSFGAPGLDRLVRHELARAGRRPNGVPPGSRLGQPAPHAHRRHRVRAHGVASACSLISRGS